MAIKKKSKKQMKKRPVKAKKTARKQIAAKRSAKKKLAPKKAAAKTKPSRKQILSVKSASAGKKQTRAKTRRRGAPAFSGERQEPFPGELTGDLQGLSDRETVDSESVDELLEEGNAFEAEVVSGVEEAEDLGDKEVHTHEVPEDDVPGEYLDED